MAFTLDLEKSAAAFSLSLEKAGILTPPPVDLVFDLDVSGSFDDEHQDGLTNMLLQRLVPWGMVFDPDKKLDVFTFSDSLSHAHYVGEVTPETCGDYVRRNIINKVPGYNGRTDYSYVLEKNLKHFGWIPSGEKTGGFLGWRSKPKVVEKRRSLVIFVTDGANDDKERTIKVLADSEARGDQVYFMFLGVSNQQTNFRFIDKLGERFGNVGFVAVKNVAEWVKQTDEAINDQLLGEELIDWLKAV
jgi:hypothetical protein